jgi:hypothetical protein
LLGAPVMVIVGPGACTNNSDWVVSKLALPGLHERKKVEKRVANTVKADGITIEWLKISPLRPDQLNRQSNY